MASPYSRTYSSATVTTDEAIAADHLNAEFTTIFTGLGTGGITATELATNAVTTTKIKANAVIFTKIGCEVDEDDMTSDSAVLLPTQQSVKAYVDNKDIDGTPTAVTTKYLTGSLDSDDTTEVLHGCTAAQILDVGVICYDNNSSAYVAHDYRASASTNGSLYVYFDTTKIYIAGVGSNFWGQAYKIKVDCY